MNRKLYLTLRTLFGLFMIFSGVTGLMAGPNAVNVPEPMAPAFQQLWSMGLMQLIKIAEIIGGLMLTIGFLPALGAIITGTILIGATVFNARVAPMYVITPLILSLLNIAIGYAQWEHYKQLFRKVKK